ncbi:unnamed protein product [Allacma fusca]|uniref:Uncharacterized protein n=1 Tax=Allacma fusca TaxID=39272 RepID=A0A8J2JGF9_9HEXA|nr:unnamed protein product [Allacma fusca]
MKLLTYFLTALLTQCLSGADDFFYECIHNKGNFETAGWTNISGTINWASDENQLPVQLKGKLRGQFGDVFYFDAAQQPNGAEVEKDYTSITYPFPALIYYRYYVHDPNDFGRSYLKSENSTFILEDLRDFQWKETYTAVVRSSKKGFGLSYENQQGGSIFLIDTIIYTQADNFFFECIHNKEDFTIAGWTNVTSIINWASDETQLPLQLRGKLRGQFQEVFYFDSSQQFYSGKARKDYKSVTAPYPAYIYYKYYAHDPNGKASFYMKEKNWYNWLDVPNDLQWAEALTSVTTSTQIEFGRYLEMEDMKALCPEESHAVLECIDEDNDFSYNSWQSYPLHSYFEDPTELPVDHQGSLNATGIFILEGSSRYKTQTISKNFHKYGNWAQIPTYLYLKYYAALKSNNSQVIYTRPVF